MKVLYVTSACLTKNTSANMSHNGYVKGLIDNGNQVSERKTKPFHIGRKQHTMNSRA